MLAGEMGDGFVGTGEETMVGRKKRTLKLAVEGAPPSRSTSYRGRRARVTRAFPSIGHYAMGTLFAIILRE